MSDQMGFGVMIHYLSGGTAHGWNEYVGRGKQIQDKVY